MPSRIASRLLEFFGSAGRTALFAGAGVGKHVGFPLWHEYVESLAAVAETYEPETAVLMRKRLAAQLYIDALHLYKTCALIPRGVMFDHLAKPFREPGLYEPTRLSPLLTLPFAAAVTTNYDRSLHDCHHRLASRSSSALTVELGDVSMRQAVYWNEFFIARIHGRAEVPETMVVDTDDYRRTADDAAYTEFLLHVLKTYRCLFVGYSFVDPALTRVLILMADLVPQPYPRLHVALVPQDASAELTSRLANFNIEAVVFDPASAALELWNGIRDAARLQPTTSHISVAREALPGLKRLIASAYARLQLGRQIEPLREIVTEGIVAQTLSVATPSTPEAITAAVKQYIGLPDTDVGRLVASALDQLLQQGLARETDVGIVAVAVTNETELDAAIRSLANGAMSRLKVREGVDATPDLQRGAESAIQELLMTRGWDLGAHYAAGRREDFEAWDQIAAALEPLVRTPSNRHRRSLQHALFDLLRHPDDIEASILADLGRLAFAVELVVNNSRTVIGASPFIPETIYLDANVVMPAIVDGHPYGPVYGDTIARLHSAAGTVGRRLSVAVAYDFLNEIVSHRTRAIEMAAELQLDDPEELRRHILFYGAENTNVFIGAYGSWVGRLATPISFAEFLRTAAPYDNEEQLEVFLRRRGIKTERIWFTEDEMPLFRDVAAALDEAFEREDSRSRGPKAGVLRQHEARQLTHLLLRIQQRRSVMFVTADKTLIRAATGPVLGDCGTAITSHLAFVQLVDLMLGVSTDKSALVRLMWNVHVADTRTLVRNYLIDRALAFYDEAKTMAQWQVIERITDEAVAAADAEGVPLLYGASDAARNAKFLDRFEKKFYEGMEEAIREAERRN